MDQMEKRQIPWTMVFGNHDDEGFFGLSRKKMMNKMRQKAFAYIHPGPEQVDGIGNFALTIQTSENEEEKELVRLYFLDSHATADSTNFPQQNGRNDWIKPSQLDFYQALSNSLNKHTEIPGVLFFHIPLPEYSLVSPDEPLRMGGHFEKVDAPFVNTGLFSLLVEQDHIKAIVVGHDHANDFCYQRESIHLCYAGCPGFGLAYGRHDLPRRVRILEWKFDLPKKKQKLFTYERIYGDKTKEKKDFQELYAI
jgi:DNA repair exonuclease SbcCD nuclease subunit